MDNQTLLLMLALGNLTFGAGLFLLNNNNRKSIELNRWSQAKLLQGFAWILLYSNTQIYPVFSILLGHCLLFAGVALDAWAMRDEESQQRSFLLPLWGIAVITFSGLYLFSVDLRLRTAVASFLLSVFYLVLSATLWRQWRTSTRLRRFVMLSTVMVSSLISISSLVAILYSNVAMLMQNSQGQAIISLGLYFLMMVNGFGGLLLAREQRDAELIRLELIDPLTNAPNRRGFFNALAPWLALARRPGHSTALIMLDLDHFKRINDNYGHSVGDQVLKEVVDVGKTQLRDSDLIGRLGGEEFAVLLPRTNLHDASIVAERMRQAIMAFHIKAEKAILTTTASFGVTTIRPDDSMVSLIKRADDALFAAKNAGRNQVMEAAPVEQLLE